MSLASDIFNRARQDTALLLKNSAKALTVLAVAAALALPLDPASAASGGGRMGGSSFRSAPSRSVAPRSGYSGGGGGIGVYGGGGYYGGYAPSGLFLNPFIMPIGIGGVGFGGFGSLLLFATAAGFILNSLQRRSEVAEEVEAVDPVTAVTVLKVGLLATARQLQVDLDFLARQADTGNVAGLRYVLAETVTSLLRNPDYWMYGSVKVNQARLSKAEGMFNQVCLEERLKLEEETLTNTEGRRMEKERARAKRADMSKAPGEYIVVSLVVAAAGSLIKGMPKEVDSTADVDRALRALGGVDAEDLQAVEVVWAPQSLRDTLSERELLGDHPELRRL